MEGGSSVVDWISYGIIGFVLFALAVLVLRSAWFFLSLLAIPLTDTLARHTPLGGMIRRWGERGPEMRPLPATTGIEPPREAVSSQVPARVRRAIAIGAGLGAMPGLWWAMRGAIVTRRAGGSWPAALAEAALGVGLVATAGLLVGMAAGALAGLAIEAIRKRPAADD